MKKCNVWNVYETFEDAFEDAKKMKVLSPDWFFVATKIFSRKLNDFIFDVSAVRTWEDTRQVIANTKIKDPFHYNKAFVY